MVAVELKLIKWREAIEQAVCYKHFANRSYICIDSGRHKEIMRIKDGCRRAQIGLLLQSPSGLKTALRAPSTIVISAERHIAVQKLKSAEQLSRHRYNLSTSGEPLTKQLDAERLYA